jgi:copper resistance protein B
MRLFLCLMGLMPSLVLAMDHDPVFSYTRAELASGQTRHQAGSAQSLSLDGWIGGDIDRLWWQSDAAWQAGKTGGSSAGAWYGHYIAPFWDAQIGLRSEGSPHSANYLSAGVRGLAPYQFDTDIKFDLRSDGKWLVHGRFEQEVLMTNRFILRPWLSGYLSGADIDATVRRGLYQADFGLQARYEFTREFAPFMEITRTFYLRTVAGGEPDSTRILAGVRFIF